MMLQGGGRVEPGAPGDLAAVDLGTRPGLRPASGDRLVSALVYSAQLGDVSHLIVAGRPVLYPESREKLLGIYEESMSRVEEFMERLEPGEAGEPPCSPVEACP